MKLKVWTLRQLLFNVIILGILGLAHAQPTLGVYADRLPRFDCESNEAHSLSEVIFELDIKVLEAGRAKGEFSTGVSYTDSGVNGFFDVAFNNSILEGIIIGTQDLMGETFSPYKLELIWNPLAEHFEGLITNLSPIRCDDGKLLREFLFVQLERIKQ